MAVKITKSKGYFIDVLKLAQNVLKEQNKNKGTNITQENIFKKASVILKNYDKNHDGIISSNADGFDEVKALKTEYRADLLKGSVFDNARMRRTDYQNSNANTIVSVVVDVNGDNTIDFQSNIGRNGSVCYFRQQDINKPNSEAGYNYKK